MVLDALAEALPALDCCQQRVLVAVSGGVDSTVLAHGLHASAERFGLELALGHVNHGLRASAAADEADVGALAARLGLPFRVRHVAPEQLRRAGPSRARPTLQEAARRLRYDALDAIARELGASRIATAHSADDQAETVLLRILRGTGPAGLAGIPPRSPDGRIVRPLLRVSRAAIEVWARERGLGWREDESNRSERFARARLRHRWLPGLAADFNPRLLRALADLAEAQRRESDWIETQLGPYAASCLQRAEGGGVWIDRAGWDRVPEALAPRLLRRTLRRLGAGRDVSRVHLERAGGFLRAGRPGGRLELPGGLVLVCHGPRFRLAPPGVGSSAAC